jgi:hypothetical protein
LVRNAVLCLGISVSPANSAGRRSISVAVPCRSLCLSTFPTKSLVDELRLRRGVGPAGRLHGTMCTSVRRKARDFWCDQSRTIPFHPSSLIFPLTQRYSSAVLAPAEPHASYSVAKRENTPSPSGAGSVVQRCTSPAANASVLDAEFGPADGDAEACSQTA